MRQNIEFVKPVMHTDKKRFALGFPKRKKEHPLKKNNFRP